MILGMMQPYFFPYLGYWQLMNMVDEYIIYDDVNFIKGGWIHRNHIKINGERQVYGLSLKKASQNRAINDHEINLTEDHIRILLEKYKNAYGKAPYCKQVYELISDILHCGKTNLAEFLAYENRKVAEYMGITTPIYSATELGLPHELTGEDRVIALCKLRGADQYVNAIGGTVLYDRDRFEEAGCPIRFLRMNGDIIYPQGKGDYIQGLSIIDVLSWNSKEEIQKLLTQYTLE